MEVKDSQDDDPLTATQSQYFDSEGFGITSPNRIAPSTSQSARQSSLECFNFEQDCGFELTEHHYSQAELKVPGKLKPVAMQASNKNQCCTKQTISEPFIAMGGTFDCHSSVSQDGECSTREEGELKGTHKINPPSAPIEGVVVSQEIHENQERASKTSLERGIRKNTDTQHRFEIARAPDAPLGPPADSSAESSVNADTVVSTASFSQSHLNHPTEERAQTQRVECDSSLVNTSNNKKRKCKEEPCVYPGREDADESKGCEPSRKAACKSSSGIEQVDMNKRVGQVDDCNLSPACKSEGVVRINTDCEVQDGGERTEYHSKVPELQSEKLTSLRNTTNQFEKPTPLRNTTNQFEKPTPLRNTTNQFEKPTPLRNATSQRKEQYRSTVFGNTEVSKHAVRASRSMVSSKNRKKLFTQPGLDPRDSDCERLEIFPPLSAAYATRTTATRHETAKFSSDDGWIRTISRRSKSSSNKSMHKNSIRKRWSRENIASALKPTERCQKVPLSSQQKLGSNRARNPKKVALCHSSSDSECLADYDRNKASAPIAIKRHRLFATTEDCLSQDAESSSDSEGQGEEEVLPRVHRTRSGRTTIQTMFFTPCSSMNRVRSIKTKNKFTAAVKVPKTQLGHQRLLSDFFQPAID